jgi:demethoxyubiquinone hydroxylase (CLK1/Coq7/Cat5 family)
MVTGREAGLRKTEALAEDSTGILPDSERAAIRRIVKVNHAGEYAAIRIYGAQIMVAGWF